VSERLRKEEIIRELKSLSNPEAVAGMARYGIEPKNAYGVSAPDLRRIAKETGNDHELALRLWKTENREARIIASMIDIPSLVSEEQMEAWVKDFNSWDVCDGVCNCLFRKTERAHKKAVEWAKRKDEFVKRAGFVLMACLAVHDKNAEDKEFIKFFPLIKKESIDARNFVKKAVNWALRQIGKRNIPLNKAAVEIAGEISEIDSKSTRWIASDALRELTGEAVQKRLRRKR